MRTARSPKVAALALLAAALALAAAVATRSWFTADGGRTGIGLTGVNMCEPDGSCQIAGWSELSAPGQISTFGYVGYAAGLLAALGCIVVAAMMLAGRAHKLPARQVGAGLGGGLTVGALGQLAFVNRVLDSGGLRHASIGWSLIVAFAAGLAAAVVVKTLVMPALAAATARPAPAPAPEPYTIA